MSMPEFVIQRGVEYSWSFLRDKMDYVVGYYLRQLPWDRQQEYRDLITTQTPSIFMGYPTVGVSLPSFTVVLVSENEDPSGQYVGDTAHNNRLMPFPAAGEDDYLPFEDFDGVVYPDYQEPQLLGVDGERGTREPYAWEPREKNLWQQRRDHQDGDEQHEEMGEVRRLWSANKQRLSAHSVGDRITADILITTNNAEQTMVYYRLLRFILRRFKTWFEKNGVQDPVFSGRELASTEAVIPGVSIPVFQRTISMNFLHQDVGYQVDKVLEDWMLEIELVTRNPDGSVSVVETLWPNPEDDDDE